MCVSYVRQFVGMTAYNTSTCLVYVYMCVCYARQSVAMSAYNTSICLVYVRTLCPPVCRDVCL